MMRVTSSVLLTFVNEPYVRRYNNNSEICMAASRVRSVCVVTLCTREQYNDCLRIKVVGGGGGSGDGKDGGTEIGMVAMVSEYQGMRKSQRNVPSIQLRLSIIFAFCAYYIYMYGSIYTEPNIHIISLCYQ